MVIKTLLPPDHNSLSKDDQTTVMLYEKYKTLQRMCNITGLTHKMAFNKFKQKYKGEKFFPAKQSIMVTNGTEPKFSFNKWFIDHDREKYAKSNNCYSFALGDVRKEIGDQRHGLVGQQCKTNSNINPSNKIMSIESMRNKMLKLILCDVQHSWSKDAYIIKKTEVPKEGFHRMVAMFDKQSNNTRRADYHYARQTPCGMWVHKGGWYNKPKFHDSNGQLIFEPDKATWNWGTGINYNIIAGFLAVPNRSNNLIVVPPTIPKMILVNNKLKSVHTKNKKGAYKKVKKIKSLGLLRSQPHERKSKWVGLLPPW